MLPEGLALDSLLLDSELSGEGMPSGKSPEATVEEPTAEPTAAPTAEPVDEVEGSAEEPIEIPDEPTGVNAEGALDEIALDTTEPTLEGIEADSEIVEDSLAQFELFDQSATVDGVVSSVSAPAGVFPADAVLSEKNATAREAKRADAAIDAARDEEQNVVASYTFDISVLGGEGNELQSTEGFEVQVSFAMAEVADEGLNVDVYHMSEEGKPARSRPSALAAARSVYWPSTVSAPVSRSL